MAGQLAAFCRQYSIRPASLETNSWKSTIRFSAHTPPGLRKSGTPDSVEIPAPVNPTMRDAPATSARAAVTAVSAGILRPLVSSTGRGAALASHAGPARTITGLSLVIAA